MKSLDEILGLVQDISPTTDNKKNLKKHTIKGEGEEASDCGAVEPVEAKPEPKPEKDTPQPAPAQPVQQKKQTSSTAPSMPSVAKQFLLSNLKELRSHGWTSPELFKRTGRRIGLYWCGVWNKDDLKVDLEGKGIIRLSWVNAQGKEISQSARPMGLPGRRF